jgi:hypothetical protein
MGKGRSSDFTESGYQPAGIYGWRKQCLYAIILFILVVVIMNLALTVWILRVLNFNIVSIHAFAILAYFIMQINVPFRASRRLRSWTLDLF